MRIWVQYLRQGPALVERGAHRLGPAHQQFVVALPGAVRLEQSKDKSFAQTLRQGTAGL
jgi:hypothetical protein